MKDSLCRLAPGTRHGQAKAEALQQEGPALPDPKSGQGDSLCRTTRCPRPACERLQVCKLEFIVCQKCVFRNAFHTF